MLLVYCFLKKTQLKAPISLQYAYSICRYRKEEKMIELRPSDYPLTLPATLPDGSIGTLENSLGAYLGCNHVIALNSVDAAFALAFSIFGKESGILCSPNAPIALFQALRRENLHAQYCDLKLDGTLETRFLQKSRTGSSKALLVSHNHGQLSEMEKLGSFAKADGLLLIEDATQAFGRREQGNSTLAIYDLEALLPSFIARGGFVATDDAQLAAELRHKAKGGYLQKRFWNYDIDALHENVTMDTLTAAIALDALSEIGNRQATIHEIRTFYRQKLASNPLVELPKAASLPCPLFAVALVPALFCPKEEIYQALREKGVPVQVGNKPIYKTTAFKDETLSLFGAEEVYKAQLLLPSHHLMSLDEAASVVATFESVLAAYGYRGCSF